MTRERMHQLIETLWAPGAYREKDRRHAYVDALFDSLEQEYAAAVAADVLQRYPDTWQEGHAR